MLKTYNPKKVIVVLGGFVMSGYAEGSFVTVARNSDAFALTMGADGDGTRAKSNDRSGTITLRLAASSQANAFLSAFALADENSDSGLFPALVKDVSGKSIHGAEQAWVKKLPDAEYAKENTEREWVIETDNLQSFIGGN